MSDAAKLCTGYWEHRGGAVNLEPTGVILKDFLEQVTLKLDFSGEAGIRQMRGNGKDNTDRRGSMYREA